MGILGSFGTDAMASIPGILGGISTGIDQNRMAMMGMGLGLMGGGGSAASMKAAMEGLTSGSRADYLRIHEENARRQKEQEYARQVAMAKAAGLDPVFAGSSVVDKVLANKYAPDKTGRGSTALEQLRAAMTPEQFKSYMDKQAGIKPVEPETWEPTTIETGGGKATVWKSSRGNVSSRPPAGVDLDDLAVQAPKARQLPAEVASRVSLAETFLDRLEDKTDARGKVIEGLETKVKRGDVTGPIENTMAQYGVGEAGRIYGDLETGQDALQRTLTGAGMSVQESENYSRRYLPTKYDKAEDAAYKLKRLKTELRGIVDDLKGGRDPLAKIKAGGTDYGPDAAGNSIPDGTTAKNSAGVTLVRRNGQWVDPTTGRPW